MTLKKFYLKNYPTDELGAKINSKSTFKGLIKTILKKDDVYDYIGVNDSLVRERLFVRLSLDRGVFFDLIYDLWTGKI
tara:strand:- start:20 stop:253 length:234 start_codon:yes stop_codon:yes gene_type:complete